jgi:hypothetical protein
MIEIPDASDLPYSEMVFDGTGSIRIVHGIDAIVERIKTRLRFFRKEWFLDQRLGMPYRERIFVKNPDLVLISFIFKKALVSTPGVKAVNRFSARIDASTRTLFLDFEAQIESGTVLRVTAEPFIIGEF